MPDISVIIPVYNTAPYLEGCIKSILGQSFQRYELILIDDGSTDGSSDICNQITQEDSRVTCLHQRNQGQQKAVQNGISHASSQWLCFVDSDDTLPQDALETLFSQTSESTDIIVGFSFPGDNSVKHVSITDWQTMMFRGSEVLCTRWGKLYRRSLFDNESTCVPSDIRVGEDMIMNIKLAFNSLLPVTIINHKVYCYNRNIGSVSSTYRWTAERYARLFDELRASIPSRLTGTNWEKVFRQAGVSNAFSMVKNLLTFENRSSLKLLSRSRLLADLRKEVDETNYKMCVEEKLLLHYPSSILTHRYFVLKRLFIISMQSLKRRLGL